MKDPHAGCVIEFGRLTRERDTEIKRARTAEQKVEDLEMIVDSCRKNCVRKKEELNDHTQRKASGMKPIRGWATANNSFDLNRWNRWQDLYFMSIYATKQKAEDHLRTLEHHDLKIFEVEIRLIKKSKKERP